jgi:transposase InsO family protein
VRHHRFAAPKSGIWSVAVPGRGTQPAVVHRRHPDPHGQGWLYAVVVLDVYSRLVVSWAVSNQVRIETALEALDAAIQARRPRPDLIVHSD